MTIAVIETGGKQYLVSPGEIINTEKNKTGNKKLSFDALLFASGDDVKVGKPKVESKKVGGVVIETALGKKVITMKYKPKARTRVKKGHRQISSKVKIGDF